MTIDTEKLRALHAATTQGEWMFANHEPAFPSEYSWDDFEWIDKAHNIFPALLDEIEGLRALNNTLWQQNNRLQEELFEARNNDRIAMAWLADCKQAAWYEGDFPGLVERIAQLRKVLGYFLGLEDDFNEEYFSYACRQASKFIDPGEQS